MANGRQQDGYIRRRALSLCTGLFTQGGEQLQGRARPIDKGAVWMHSKGSC